jgi:Family of unknown function (DUF6152)
VTPAPNRRTLAPSHRRTACTLIVLLALTGVLGAHHAIGGIYDAARPVTLEGVVSGFRFVPPHPFVEIDVTDRGGKTLRWRLELDNHFELVDVGMTADTLKPGDAVIVTGSGARNQDRSVYVRRLERRSDGFLYEQVGSSPRVRHRR